MIGNHKVNETSSKNKREYYFLWILLVAAVPVITTVHQLILFGIYFFMYNVKYSQVKSCLIRYNAYFHNNNFL